MISKQIDKNIKTAENKQRTWKRIFNKIFK